MAFSAGNFWRSLRSSSSDNGSESAPADQPAPNTAEQMASAAHAENMLHQRRMNEIGQWSTAVSNWQHHMLSGQAAGLDPRISMLPWAQGVTNVNVAPPPAPQGAEPRQSRNGGFLPKAALGALSLLGAGVGGFGLASLLGYDFGSGGERPAATAPAGGEQEYEWIVEVRRDGEWERISRGESSTGVRGGESGDGGGIQEDDRAHSVDRNRQLSP